MGRELCAEVMLFNEERRTSNIQHPTSNRRESGEKDGPFRLLFSPLMFDVGRSMLDVRRSYSFFRREVLWILDWKRAVPSGNANIEHPTPNIQRRTEENQELAQPMG